MTADFVRIESGIPGLETFAYPDQSHMLFIYRDTMFLYNLSSKSFLEEIYNVTFSQEINGYEIIEDLTGDHISEIITISWEGNVTLINGLDGTNLMDFNISPLPRARQLPPLIKKGTSEPNRAASCISSSSLTSKL